MAESEEYIGPDFSSKDIFHNWIINQPGIVKYHKTIKRWIKHDFWMLSGNCWSVGEIKHRKNTYSASTLMLEFDKYNYLTDYVKKTYDRVKRNTRPYYVNVFSDRIILFDLLRVSVKWVEQLHNATTTATGGAREKKPKLVTYLNQSEGQIYLIQ